MYCLLQMDLRCYERRVCFRCCLGNYYWMVVWCNRWQRLRFGPWLPYPQTTWNTFNLMTIWVLICKNNFWYFQDNEHLLIHCCIVNNKSFKGALNNNVKKVRKNHYKWRFCSDMPWVCCHDNRCNLDHQSIKKSVPISTETKNFDIRSESKFFNWDWRNCFE